MTITRTDLDAGLVDFSDTSPELWLGLQDAYDLAVARAKGAGADVRVLPALA